MDRLFLLIDTNRTGRIDFYELTIGLELLSSGNTERKLRLIFDLFDLDDNKELTEDEITALAEVLQQIAGDTGGSLCLRSSAGVD
eukprot:gene4202-14574_t